MFVLPFQYRIINQHRKILNIFLIGSGNVAHHLSLAFDRSQHTVIGYYSRQKKDTLGGLDYYGAISKIPQDADIYIIAVSDDAIATVSNALPTSIQQNRLVVHTSGTKPSEALKKCVNTGIFYPLQTFTAGVALDYASIPFCIHAHKEKTKELLFSLASDISNAVQYITDEERARIHVSAVMINNFINHIIYKAESYLEEHEIDPTILQPLLSETIKKQAAIGALKAQTGPAKRNDSETIKKHIDLLDKKIDKKVYKAISKSIKKTYS